MCSEREMLNLELFLLCSLELAFSEFRMVSWGYKVLTLPSYHGVGFSKCCLCSPGAAARTPLPASGLLNKGTESTLLTAFRGGLNRFRLDNAGNCLGVDRRNGWFPAHESSSDCPGARTWTWVEVSASTLAFQA